MPEEQSIFDVGYSPELERADAYLQPSLGEFSGAMPNPVEDEMHPQVLANGAMTQLLYSKKELFSSTDSGYRMGLDPSDEAYKWVIGDASSSADWNVTTADTFTIKGTLAASTITGSTLTGSTITGGTIQTATSGQRIRMVAGAAVSPSQSANSLALIDSSDNILVQFGDLEFALLTVDVKTDQPGIRIASSIDHVNDLFRVTSTNANATLSTGLANVTFGGDAGPAMLLSNSSTANADAPLELSSVYSGDSPFRKMLVMEGVSIYKSNGSTSPDGNLSGTAGDLCLNGFNNQAYYCTGTTNWTAL